MGLMYGKEDQLVPRECLGELVTPEPLGPRHNPFPFVDFVRMIEQGLHDRHIEVISQEFAVTRDSKRIFGAMHIRPPDFSHEDWNLILGLRGAHDYKFARSVALGSQVTVCSNLCFHGDLGTWKTKQTTDVANRLPHLVDIALNQLPQAVDGQQGIFDAYRDMTLSDNKASAILVEIYRRNGLSAPQLARSIDEWYKPTHDYGRNLYTLFNGCTEALKPTGNGFHPELMMRRSNVVTEILDDMVDK